MLDKPISKSVEKRMAIQKPKCSPRPWVLEEDEIIYGSDGYMVADTDCEQEPQIDKRSANAEIIISCVNAMEGIGKPAAVKELIEAIEEYLDKLSGVLPIYYRDRIKKALAALEMVE